MVNFKSLVPWRNHSVQTPTAREELFDPFLGFRRKIDLIFEDFFESAGWRPFGGTSGVMPAIDFVESDNEFIVTSELPGVSEKDIKVDLAGDLLTIKGEERSSTRTATAPVIAWSADPAHSSARSACHSRSRTSRLTPSSAMASWRSDCPSSPFCSGLVV